MKPTIYILLEQGTQGVLTVSEDRYLIQALSSGIIDSEPVNFFGWEQHRWEIDIVNETMATANDWSLYNRYSFLPIDSTSQSYPIFKKKKELVQLRTPLCEILIHTARHYKNKYNTGFSDDEYETVFEILKDSQLVKQYAKAIESTTMIANQELNLTYQSNKDMVSRVYIAYQYYLHKINKITTRQEFLDLMNQITNGFTYGHGFE